MTQPSPHATHPIAPSKVTIETVGGRTTALPPERQFRAFLDRSGARLADSASALMRMVGAPRLVAAAVSEESGQVQDSLARPVGQFDDLLGASTAANDHYLLLQERISAENRRFTALSNVLKARHDTAKAAVNNIR